MTSGFFGPDRAEDVGLLFTRGTGGGGGGGRLVVVVGVVGGADGSVALGEGR